MCPEYSIIKKIRHKFCCLKFLFLYQFKASRSQWTLEGIWVWSHESARASVISIKRVLKINENWKIRQFLFIYFFSFFHGIFKICISCKCLSNAKLNPRYFKKRPLAEREILMTSFMVVNNFSIAFPGCKLSQNRKTDTWTSV